MSTLPFKSTPTDQVRLNLIHYNLWTKVEVHNDYILSGLPPTKLVSTDNESKREWIVCKRLNQESRLKVKEINSWFEEIKQFTSGKGDQDQDVDNDTKDSSTRNGKSDVESPSGDVPSPVDNDSPIWKPIDKTMNGKGRVERLTIALINDDGTIVYYFIHDGITKPRQN
ncbi:SEN15 [Candida metapsilosis]|uniref:SEN15 n=1 Tax=Candida metapsilosis TaxID=273372 RepID=A0A8H7ZLD0_9ASCO|nr:SEN15 [Candida metapsilosis]